MKKKLVMGTMIITMVSGLLAGGAFAAFSDIETTSGNTFTAGTLDLKTDDADGVTQTLYAVSMKPGDSIGPATIVLKNAGNLDGSSLDMDTSYVESDGSPNSVDKTADQTAVVLRVDTLEYGEIGSETDLLSLTVDTFDNAWIEAADVDDNQEITLYELKLRSQTVAPLSLSGINGSQSKGFNIEVALDTTDNDFQADGIDIDLTFTLNQ